MNCLEVGERSGASPVKQVGADADVSSASSLPAAGVGERVLDCHTLAEPLSPRGRSRQFLQALLQRLVVGDRNGASVAGRAIGALPALGTAVAQLGIEFDRRAEFEALGMAFGTSDGPVTDVDLEERLGEVVAIARRPWTTDDIAVVVGDLLDERRVDVGPVDIGRSDRSTEIREVFFEIGRRFLFGAIGRRHGAGQDESGVEIEREMALEAIEAFALALPSVPHLLVFDGDAAIGRDALPHAMAAAAAGV